MTADRTGGGPDTHASGSLTPMPDPFAAARRRYDQCDDTCTVDCGHCKGAGRPVVSPVQGEAVEGQSMQWAVPVGKLPGYTAKMSAESANKIVAWVNTNGGEARYVPDGEDTSQGWSGYPRIAVRTANGWSYAKPGDYMVMGTATFCVHGDDHGGFCRREFTVCGWRTVGDFDHAAPTASTSGGEAVETRADCTDPAWLRTLADALASHDPQGIDYRGALRVAADEIERLRRPVAGSPEHPDKPQIEYSIVRDPDGYRYSGYNENCRPPEPIIGDEHIEQREVYRTPWRRVDGGSPVHEGEDEQSVRLVRQEHDYGCGIASLAMITSSSYDDVREWLLANWPGGQADGGQPTEQWLEKRGIYSGIADWYLSHHGYVWRKLYSGWAKDNPRFEWPPAPFAPVHLVMVRQPSGNSHYVVMRADGVVLDPMTDEPRTLADWSQIDNVQGIWRLGVSS